MPSPGPQNHYTAQLCMWLNSACSKSSDELGHPEVIGSVGTAAMYDQLIPHEEAARTHGYPPCTGTDTHGPSNAYDICS